MNAKVLKVHPADNVIVALTDLAQGDTVSLDGASYTLKEPIAAKHKFTMNDMAQGDKIKMYGLVVGTAKNPIPQGMRISVENTTHAVGDLHAREKKTNWIAPDVSKWKSKTFMGYHRSDGSVGTANYWVVVPMVFCENKNVDSLKEALLEELGFSSPKKYKQFTKRLISMYQSGQSVSDIQEVAFDETTIGVSNNPLFPNVDGIRFLTHSMGCGGTRQDAQALCGLLAGYITNPNVAGATVLSLGCQNAQASILKEEIDKRSPQFNKPFQVFEQQKMGREADLIGEAVKQIFTGLIIANQAHREPAPLSKLCVGLECGGSDGFSGISANPAIGYTSDLISALGGSVILSEFPELCGVEQELCDRCVDEATANRFVDLMTRYNQRAHEAGSGFDMNPSPGNIKDGLITDAIKSAGAAKKGGTSPVMDVLDYPEKVRKQGLTLLCTPGNDVESTTGMVGSGATICLFTTGLGTPTGNPIAPVIKLSSNTKLYEKMPDIIDINTGPIIEGSETIEQTGERILEYLIKVASGEEKCAADRNGQEDFIPWKRGVSL
ncbi:altronate dehydratase family protein [uncultured Imperialibacter sp.]|uniref:UxaA family hydrolase n=1 Tax=uncultured Imperialibacter sp. TaxID=1672639 RepID=UPI0030DDC584|tara:strand:- start:9400 stop:11052 length:1653 start_codon:yes stop_codon:yes gene_type:complete